MINVAGQHFNLIAVIGGITILIAAALAFVQNDIKKVLAYSTVSQLGYMMMGLGVGAWVPGRVPHLHPRLLQVLPVPVRRLGRHTGQPPQLRHEEGHGRLGRKMPITFVTWMIVDGGAVRRAVLLRLLLQGRDHRLRRPLPLRGVHRSSA